jgi:hypothetical protein
MVVPLSPHVLKADANIGRPAYILVVPRRTRFVIHLKMNSGFIFGLTTQERVVADAAFDKVVAIASWSAGVV